MKTTISNLGLLILVVAAVGSLGMTQETAQSAAKEKHVKDIWAEQTREAQSASPLCQETIEMRKRPKDSFNLHELKVDPATLEPNLESLMEKSDEVVLVGQDSASALAISPSGKDVAQYYDVKVLRSWKGSHKVGDTLTFAMPGGDLNCLTPGIPHQSWVDFVTIVEGGPSGNGSLPWGGHILFLRQTHGDETPFLPGLRLTGGNGIQGIYTVPFSLHDQTCVATLPEDMKTCRAFLETSQIPVNAQYYAHDPLIKKYDGMPTSDFLRLVQSVADSLGYTSSAVATK
jgi:hypothetical protein